MKKRRIQQLLKKAKVLALLMFWGFCCCSFSIYAQDSTRVNQKQELRLHGKVTDERKNPLPGVTVRIKDVLIGVATDKDGKYSILVPKRIAKPVLVFSFVGMTSKEIPYSGNDEINVILVEEQAEINEVVVTGMFNRRVESFTGAATTLKERIFYGWGIRI